ncbi:Nitrogen regulatory protein P-II 2 [compost metagenome]
MKLLTVIFPTSRREKVVRALSDHPVPGLSLSRTEGFGKATGPLGLTERCRVEMVLPEAQLKPVLALLESVLSTGNPEDGVVFWQDLEGYRHL